METATAPVTTSVRTLEAETEATTRIQPSKPLSFTNGVLKRHHPLHHYLNGPPVVVIYKECLKNHAASMGGHAVDGCCEFMPSPTTNPADPTSLKCAACGCHRNFHRREPEEPLPPSQLAIEYHPHHRHHPPPPPQPLGGHSSPNSASPPPISSSFPSAPHMLLALSGGLSGSPPENPSPMTAPGGTPASFAAAAAIAGSNSNGRKRFRTKFTHIQKEKMYELAERIGWKMQKRDDGLIAEICGEVGVEKGVFKVWMHNNKSTLGKRHLNNHHYNSNGIGGGNSLNDSTTPSTHSHHHDNDGSHHNHRHHSSNDISVSADGVATNGSSSTS